MTDLLIAYVVITTIGAGTSAFGLAMAISDSKHWDNDKQILTLWSMLRLMPIWPVVTLVLVWRGLQQTRRVVVEAQRREQTRRTEELGTGTDEEDE